MTETEDSQKTYPTIRIGMIGAGLVGQAAHIANFQALPDACIFGLAELRQRLGEAVATHFNIPHLYPDHHALLADPKIEAVIVATRRHATGPIVRDCLTAGRDVLSEKPMAHTVAQARRLCATAKAANRLYGVGLMKRYDYGVARARALVRKFLVEDTLGAPLLLHGWCYGGNTGLHTYPGSRDTDLNLPAIMTDEIRPDGLELWPTLPDFLSSDWIDSYDHFLNVNVHLLNLVRFLMNETPQVRAAFIRQNNSQRSEIDRVLLDFSNCSGILTFATVDSGLWQEGICIQFERGALRLDLPPPLLPGKSGIVTIITDGTKKTLDVPDGWAFRQQAAAFVRALQEKRSGTEQSENSFQALGSDCVADLALVESIHKAALG